MQKLLFIAAMVLSCMAYAGKRQFTWRMSTVPYKNYIYRDQTSISYFLNYNYPQESKAMRRYLKSKYDIRHSVTISKIFRDVSSGIYFDRFFDVKMKYLQGSDTMFISLKYANGDSIVQRYTNIKGNTRLQIPLTTDKLHHDYASGTAKPGYKGLVVGINVLVKSNHKTKHPVCLLTKLITQADMPGIVSKLHGKRLVR